jgi:DNA-binding NtrC family response regulator
MTRVTTATDGERILVVDDTATTLDVLQRTLEVMGYRVYVAPGVAEAIRLLKEAEVDLVITDFKMPKVSGLDLVRHVRENLPNTEVMMITGYPSVPGAVEAVKTGAEAYLAKPFTDEELASAIRRALEKLRVRKAGRSMAEGAGVEPCGILGSSKAMRDVRRAIGKAAAAPATILITGESGTGKELVARAIHYNSPRAAAPFVPVNCGGIPESLLESELFGHVKGAFTGAVESRAGLFHAAEGGTVFLDEISEMSLAMQVKLLRVLQDKEVWMVGSHRPRTLNVRILAATNIDLPRLVQGGLFREDLYYRLNVIAVTVPPLRERGDDILILANHFALRFARELSKPTPCFSDDVLRILQGHNWPGNVRELENVIQRLVVMSDGACIDVPDLPAIMRFAVSPQSGPLRTLVEVEMEYICDVLARVGGNRTRAAEVLGIDRKTLREKLKKTGSSRPPSPGK